MAGLQNRWFSDGRLTTVVVFGFLFRFCEVPVGDVDAALEVVLSDLPSSLAGEPVIRQRRCPSGPALALRSIGSDQEHRVQCAIVTMEPQEPP